nr:MAG TPA: High potential iron-sulfur protein like [Caudoviricetes sp.]
MATYRIVDMYRKSKAVRGIHYDSQDNPILAYRVDKRHSLLFGLIHYWDYGAYNLCPEYLFPSIDKAKRKQRKMYKERCCGNCHWFGNEDVYGVGWCSNNEHESSCDQVCDEHKF